MLFSLCLVALLAVFMFVLPRQGTFGFLWPLRQLGCSSASFVGLSPTTLMFTSIFGETAAQTDKRKFGNGKERKKSLGPLSQAKEKLNPTRMFPLPVPFVSLHLGSNPNLLLVPSLSCLESFNASFLRSPIFRLRQATMSFPLWSSRGKIFKIFKREALLLLPNLATLQELRRRIGCISCAIWISGRSARVAARHGQQRPRIDARSRRQI